MNSSRLPGKVLADIQGKPALGRIVERLKRCEALDGIIIATTEDPADDDVEAWALDTGVPVFRGSQDDVLDRVVKAQRHMDSDVVVEICGDCPLVDAEIIDLAVNTFLANDCDVVSNTWKLSYPQGIDAQVFRRADLEAVAASVSDPAVREHVSLYFYEHPERYRIVHLIAPPGLRAPYLRLQMDYPEDHVLINKIFARLEPRFANGFGVSEIIELLDQEPQLAELNRHCEERTPR